MSRSHVVIYDNIAQYHAISDIAPKLSHSKIIFIHLHSPSQTEPVQFIHATTSVYYAWDSSILSSIICP